MNDPMHGAVIDHGSEVGQTSVPSPTPRRTYFLDGSQPLERELLDLLSVSLHELRTPLNAVQGWAQAIGIAAAEEPLVAEAVAGVKRGVREQTELLACVEDISRSLRGKDEPDETPIDLVDLMRTLVSDARPAAAARQAELVLTLPEGCRELLVRGNQDMLRRALRALLLQAVAYSPRQSAIAVRLSEFDGWATLALADEGQPPAMPAPPQPIERMRRASPGGERRTTDLDFYLAHASVVIGRMGGHIEAGSNSSAGGTVVTLQIPRADRQNPGEKALDTDSGTL